VGWTVGGGIDYAITNNWSVFAEYRYTNFGHIGSSGLFAGGFAVAPVLAGAFVNSNRTINQNQVQIGSATDSTMLPPRSRSSPNTKSNISFDFVPLKANPASRPGFFVLFLRHSVAFRPHSSTYNALHGSIRVWRSSETA